MASAKIAGQQIAGGQQQDIVAFARLQQRPDFRAKQKAFARSYQIERFDAEWIARGKKLAGRGVDRNEGIHARQTSDAGLAPYPQDVGDDFRVAFGAERHAERRQFPTQNVMIVDFAVKRDEKALVERGLRLRAKRRIHNPQTPRAHRDVASDPHKRVSHVSAMQHSPDKTPNRGFGAIPIDGHRYTAHDAPGN